MATFKFFSLTILLFSQISFANNVVTNNSSDINITIYNNNLSFINENRSTNVVKGKQQLVYENIPNSVITQSVIPSFTGAKVQLYSQNYIYNLINLSSMLKHSIDKKIKFNKYLEKDKKVIIEGVLLSTNPILVRESDTKNIISVDAKDIIFNKIPKNMITKPSLVWNINSDKAGKLDIDLKYLTKGIGWKSDYVLNLNKNTLDLNAWVTINNNSGVSFNNANINFIAGEVNTVKTAQPIIYSFKPKMFAKSAPTAIKEESFSGYHLYKIPFKETIINKQQKQISFISGKNIKYLQYGFYNTLNYGTVIKNDKQKVKFINTIEFKNTKENNLGIALPKGIVRMYKKDSLDKTHFIGEDNIANTPNKEDVKLIIGELFDVIGEKKILEYIAKKDYKLVDTKYTLKNRSKEAITLKLRENIGNYHYNIKGKNNNGSYISGSKNINSNNLSFKTSCSDKCSVEKISAFVQEFTIKLASEEVYEFNSSFEINIK